MYEIAMIAPQISYRIKWRNCQIIAIRYVSSLAIKLHQTWELSGLVQYKTDSSDVWFGLMLRSVCAVCTLLCKLDYIYPLLQMLLLFGHQIKHPGCDKGWPLIPHHVTYLLVTLGNEWIFSLQMKWLAIKIIDLKVMNQNIYLSLNYW